MKRIAFCVRDMHVGGMESVLIRTIDALLKLNKYKIVVVTYVNISEPIYRDWFAAHPDIDVRVLYPCRALGTNLPHFFLSRLIKHFMRDIYRFVRRKLFASRMFRDIDVAIDYYDFDFFPELKLFKGPRVAWWHSSENKFINGGYVKYLPWYKKFVALTDGLVDKIVKMSPGGGRYCIAYL